MRRPFSTITALLLVLVAASQGARLWLGLPITIDKLPVSAAASWTLIAIALALAIGLWFEARMHAHLAYGRRGAADALESTRSRGETYRAPKSFTVRNGRRYRATIVLGLFEQVASNETIAGMLTDAGFADVVVTGSGSRRIAEAVWPGKDVTADMPPQIVSAIELPPTAGAADTPPSATAPASSRPTPSATLPPGPPPPPPTAKPTPSPQAPRPTPPEPPTTGAADAPPSATPPAPPRPTPSATLSPGPPPPPPTAKPTPSPQAPRPTPPAPQTAQATRPAQPSGPTPLIAAHDDADAPRRRSFAERFASALSGRSANSEQPPASPPATATQRSAAGPPPLPGAPLVPTIKNQKSQTDKAD